MDFRRVDIDSSRPFYTVGGQSLGFANFSTGVHTFASNRSQLFHLETFDQLSFSPPGSRPVSKVDLERSQAKLNKLFLGDNLATLKVGAYSE